MGWIGIEWNGIISTLEWNKPFVSPAKYGRNLGNLAYHIGKYMIYLNLISFQIHSIFIHSNPFHGLHNATLEGIYAARDYLEVRKGTKK